MASSKTSTPSLFSITTLLLFILLSLLSYAKASETHHKKTSSYEFLEHLKGCHKGDKVQGIQDLKKYLEKFGYLNGDTNNDDYFDDELESAIKTYQINYHLKVTGTLDAKTLKKMEMPRCGVPDIVNGTTSMRTGKKRGGHGSTHTVGTPSEAVGAVARAFATWQGNTHFTFSQAQSFESADLKIGFGRGDHGDGANNAFDGPGKTIAHAFRPTDGRFHYDADETWVVGAVPGGFDLETVALHEIGHLLGLDHSSVPGAVMQSQIPQGYSQSLHADDVQGIRALYNT
ncbi:PREDICTED: metalloendoase [Prunus dulcis]|uniref:PREDICTED: metalloendoase n=1 Tax=Prunus dulcis TaxID=3755 RepID=A0A5E4ES05_PRUDU|nr:PREDICTED: metalloendoase [Prunus dulcis]